MTLWQQKLERFRAHTAPELVRVSRELAQARADLKQSVERLAGCELEGWTDDELMLYVHLWGLRIRFLNYQRSGQCPGQ